MAVVTGTAAAATAVVTKSAAIKAFLTGAFNNTIRTIFAGQIADMVSGGRLGNFLQRILFGKTKESNLNSNNIGLNNRLLNLKDEGAYSNTPTQGGALRFLGDRSGRLDDAPDIEPTNRSVLDNIATNQGLALGNTMVPNLIKGQSSVTDVDGIQSQIQKINQNIEAISVAMAASAGIESQYRQSLIDDLEKELAEKGKDRSETRTERSIFNFLTKRKSAIQKRTGNLANNASNAIMMSLGLEAASLFLGDKKGEDKSEESNDGDVEVDDNKTSVPEFVEGGRPLSNQPSIVGEDGAELFVPDSPGTIIPNSVMNALGLNLSVSNIFDDFLNKVFDKEENEDIGNTGQIANNINVDGQDTFTSNKVSQFISPDTTMTPTPVETMSGTTQVIDLRTAREMASVDDGGGNPSSSLDSAIPNLTPERRLSPYEGFVRSV